MKKLLILSALSLFSILLSACASPAAAEELPAPLADVENVVIAEGRLEPIEYTNIAFSTNGVVDNVLIAEGQDIAAGELIANLENTAALEAEVKRAESSVLEEVSLAYEALRIAQQRVDNYSIPSRFDGMTPTEAAAAMKIEVDKARADYEPYMNYAKPRGYVKDLKELLDNAWARYNQALEWMEREAALDAAELRIAQANADYENLQEKGAGAVQSDLSRAQIALSNAELRSPISGRVADLNLKVGESVVAGTSTVTIADFSNWMIRTTDLSELDVVNIREGQKVTITLEALPEEASLKGVVSHISENFSDKQGDILYEVSITLEETHPDLRWGMTTFIEFIK